jgi:hypothetical protein
MTFLHVTRMLSITKSDMSLLVEVKRSQHLFCDGIDGNVNKRWHEVCLLPCTSKLGYIQRTEHGRHGARHLLFLSVDLKE